MSDRFEAALAQVAGRLATLPTDGEKNEIATIDFSTRESARKFLREHFDGCGVDPAEEPAPGNGGDETTDAEE